MKPPDWDSGSSASQQISTAGLKLLAAFSQPAIFDYQSQPVGLNFLRCRLINHRIAQCCQQNRTTFPFGLFEKTPFSQLLNIVIDDRGRANPNGITDVTQTGCITPFPGVAVHKLEDSVLAWTQLVGVMLCWKLNFIPTGDSIVGNHGTLSLISDVTKY